MGIAAAILLSLVCPIGNPADPPDPTVGVGRVDNFLIPLWPPSLKAFYPEGKTDDKKAREALVNALEAMSGGPAKTWLSATFHPSDRVGIQTDCAWPHVTMLLLDVLIDELVRAGVSPDNIYVFGADEREVYTAGLSVRREGRGVKVMGAESEGFRNGLTRVLLDYCDVIINISRLKVDKRVGLWGCLANYGTMVDVPDRLAAWKEPERLCQLAARPTVRTKLKLQLMDALQPAYDLWEDKQPPPRWPYGAVVASRDPVAADLFGWKLLEAYRAKTKGQAWPLDPTPTYLIDASAAYHISRATLEELPIVWKGVEEDALIK